MKCDYYSFLLALVLGFGAHSLVQAAPVSSRVASVTGEASYALPDSETFAPLRRGMEVPSGTRIRTGSDGIVHLQVVETVAMQIGEETELTLLDMGFAEEGKDITERKARIKLTRGSVSAVLDERVPPSATDFTVSTPKGVLEAEGRFFSVSLEGQEARVEVDKGSVTNQGYPTGLVSRGDAAGRGSP